jgi:hypothetical protein
MVSWFVSVMRLFALSSRSTVKAQISGENYHPAKKIRAVKKKRKPPRTKSL